MHQRDLGGYIVRQLLRGLVGALLLVKVWQGYAISVKNDMYFLRSKIFALVRVSSRGGCHLRTGVIHFYLYQQPSPEALDTSNDVVASCIYGLAKLFTYRTTVEFSKTSKFRIVLGRRT